jgi:magnesium chelatase subunit D
MRPSFPFSAIVGRDSLKNALVLSAINPRVTGVLIRGEKGSGKSTAVRAFAALLPEVRDHDGSPRSWGERDLRFGHPDRRKATKNRALRKPELVEFPLNATEEKVIGGLDFSASIKVGAPVFEPGLLARAHLGVLYIDEVNLLPDHLVDVVLDAAVSGFNKVRREGVTVEHPTCFVLIGTMNPEEGDLRPQLLDRFGLCVDVVPETNVQSRIEIIARRTEYDETPIEFARRYEAQERALKQRIAEAAALLPVVTFPTALFTFVSEMCLSRNVAGHRADIVIAQAARALAAFHGRDRVTPEDVLEVAPLALTHRSREAPTSDREKKTTATDDSEGQNPRAPDSDPFPKRSPNLSFSMVHPEEELDVGDAPTGRSPSQSQEVVFKVGAPLAVKPAALQRDRMLRPPSGRRFKTISRKKRGRYIRAVADRRNDDVALDATLRAAALRRMERRVEAGDALVIHDEDVREKVRETRVRNFLLFMVDASGSMGARGRMSASKGAIMSLLQDAYQKRDRVAMVSFRNREAVVNLPPTSSVQRAAELLRELPTGGKTPLAAGLVKARQLLTNALIKDPACRPILIVITDGKANESVGRSDPFWEALAVAKAIAADKRVKSVVVDAEETDGFRFNLSARLSRILRAEYFRIKDLKADHLLEIARKGS